MPGDISTSLDRPLVGQELSEREWRLIRFALERAKESL